MAVRSPAPFGKNPNPELMDRRQIIPPREMAAGNRLPQARDAVDGQPVDRTQPELAAGRRTTRPACCPRCRVTFRIPSSCEHRVNRLAASISTAYVPDMSHRAALAVLSLVPGCAVATTAAIGVDGLATTGHPRAVQGRVELGIGEVTHDLPAPGQRSTQDYLHVGASAGWPSRTDKNGFQGSVLFGIDHLSYGFGGGWQLCGGAGVRSTDATSGALLQVSAGPLWFLDAHVEPGHAGYRATALALALTLGAMPQQHDLVYGVSLLLRRDAIERRAGTVDVPPFVR